MKTRQMQEGWGRRRTKCCPCFMKCVSSITFIPSLTLYTNFPSLSIHSVHFCKHMSSYLSKDRLNRWSEGSGEAQEAESLSLTRVQIECALTSRGKVMAIRLGAHNLFGFIPVQVELIWNFNWMKICAFRAERGEEGRRTCL